jgi:hypothetical protein
MVRPRAEYIGRGQVRVDEIGGQRNRQKWILLRPTIFPCLYEPACTAGADGNYPNEFPRQLVPPELRARVPLMSPGSDCLAGSDDGCTVPVAASRVDGVVARIWELNR